MTSAFKKGLKSYADFSDSEIQELWDLGIPKTYEKGEFLFSPGSAVDQAYYLGDGLAALYYMNQDKRKIVDYFCQGPNFMIDSLPHFFTGQPSYLYCEALTKLEIRVIEKKAAFEYAKSNPKLYEMLISRMLHEIMIRQEKRIRDFQLSVTDRYLQFQAEYQDAEMIIPSSYLASFLNVEPGSLSRIRKRLRQA